MHLTISCSQLRYFALMSLKGFFNYHFVVLSMINSFLLVEGDSIMHIIFLHLIYITYNNGEEILKSKKLLEKHTSFCREMWEQVCCIWFELPFFHTEITSKKASKHLTC